MPRKTNHLETVAARHRSGYEIVSALNEKTPKGEAAGYLTAVVYLAPATIAGPKSVCPHSTPACVCFHGSLFQAQIHCLLHFLRLCQHFLHLAHVEIHRHSVVFMYDLALFHATQPCFQLTFRAGQSHY